jgi:phosphate transport system substrate-binding protein
MTGAASAWTATLDPGLKDYVPRPAAPPPGAKYVLPDGTIRIVSANRGIGVVIEGFNALFAKTHPGTRFRVEYNAGGNALDMASLAHGVTAVCPLGRDINWLEETTYERLVGGPPLQLKIAHGTLTSPRMTAGLAVYINKENPIHRLTMDQLKRIFTTGAPGGDLTTWGQLGATGEWAVRPIHAYGTPESSGYGYFMLKKKWDDRPYTPGIETFDLAADIVKRVGQDLYGIGFAGQGFLTSATRLVALANDPQGPYMEGSEEEVARGEYPLDRSVGLAVRRVPGERLDPFIDEYLRLILSRQGQEIVASESDGFVPLNARQVADELAKLDAAR